MPEIKGDRGAMMEKKRSKGITALGVVTITLNALCASPFLMLLTIPVEGGKLLKIPFALIPLILCIAGVVCGINLLRLLKLKFILIVIDVTIIYYILYIAFAVLVLESSSLDLIVLASFFIILNAIILWVVTRPKVKEQFK